MSNKIKTQTFCMLVKVVVLSYYFNYYKDYKLVKVVVLSFYFNYYKDYKLSQSETSCFPDGMTFELFVLA